MPKKTTKRLYLIPILSKALDILELLQSENRPLALEAIHQRTRISKTTVYRILKTFVHRGYLAQSQDGLYRQVTRPKKLRFGFGGQSADLPFSQAVTESLQSAAASAGVDLLILDNRYDAATAVANAEEFIRSRVDLVIEFQVEQQVAPIIADRISAAGTPLIAIDIPHPHATYFGVDNYRVGFEAGELLANYARENWGGKVDWILGLDLEEAGPLVQSRITGAFEGVRSLLDGPAVESFVRIDCRGLRDKSHKVVSDFLKRHPKDKHILIATATDTSALGALAAVREHKREKHVVIVGQDALPEIIEEMRKPGCPVIGSVSHEVSQYGPSLIQLGLALLQGQTVPPYNYVQHKMIGRSEAAALA
ncbi:substrate-binding domain-containing protein [Acidipila rosea]|uniref:Monosaccharide ABC transporter substrate-binding protein (CUT2 family) n=1 Tax=Acidipila rosea TaxID=768535 RepID=A0A4R1KZB2_9BACT|nr:substrate-binding domain-containing protein [Acidipila rosea]MBW4027826.1 substrate-binding domain-containing protein [Acidobacteriota bacterium]MBW4046218.1 substrate-binding domain-containing protein [Acidobacteriota bacterium]TCK70896.1 monosaccharide ABC transporter substrate-binding protein (CUT2 family) [Acidipila rosea]